VTDAHPPISRSHAEASGRTATRGDVAALVILTLLTAVVAWNRLVFDSWLTRFDLFTFFLPWYTFLGERLRELDVPGWNPHLFSGAPFAGDPESGWMYLPAMLLFSLLPTLAAFKGMVAVQLAVAAFSTYALARALGMGAMAALTAGALYLTGPFLHWNTHCCLIFSQFAAWIPLALLGIELAVRASDWRTRIACWFLGGFAVSQMLGGWIGEGWLYAMLLPAAYIGYRAILSPPPALTPLPPSPTAVGEGGKAPLPAHRAGHPLGGGWGEGRWGEGRRSWQSRVRTRVSVGVATGIGVLGSGLALAAAGMLPRFAVNAETNLAGGDYSALGDAGVLNPPWGWDYLLAQTVGVGSGYHFRAASFGGAAVVLSLLAVLLVRRRFAVPFFAGLTFVAMLLTLEWTPLHELFYLIPRYREFHDHDAWRVIALAAIGPVMLSGATIAALPAWRGRRDLLPVVIAPLALMLLIDAVLRRREMALGWQPLVAAALTTALIAAAVAIPARNGRAAGTAQPPDVSFRGMRTPKHHLGNRSRRTDEPQDSSLSPGMTRSRGGGDALSRLIPALMLVVAFLLPTGLELTGSWLGWPPHRRWEPHWRADPTWDAALRTDVQPSDPGGAGGFLQRQLAETGPFRYAGYGGFGYPGDEARAESYMGRRFESSIQDLLVNGRPIYLGLYDIQGYNPLHLARYDEFITALNGAPQDYHTAFLLPSGLDSPLLDLLDVRYVVVDAALPRNRDDVRALRTAARAVFRTPRVAVYERDAAPPHAWIVHDVRQVARGEALPLLTSGAIDPYQIALVEGTPPETGVPREAVGESAAVIAYEPDALTIATDAVAPGLLVVSEVYASGWRAFVDGAEVPVLPTHHVLRGVPLPAGQHTVALRYDPLSLRIGVWISGVAAVAMMTAFVAAGQRRVARR
jgi:hypothetical protein